MSYCPNCNAPVAGPDAPDCANCGAMFGPGTAWKPMGTPQGPLRKFRSRVARQPRSEAPGLLRWLGGRALWIHATGVAALASGGYALVLMALHAGGRAGGDAGFTVVLGYLVPMLLSEPGREIASSFHPLRHTIESLPSGLQQDRMLTLSIQITAVLVFVAAWLVVGLTRWLRRFEAVNQEGG